MVRAVATAGGFCRLSGDLVNAIWPGCMPKKASCEES